MKLEFEYGQGLMGAELPDSTDIFIPGETVADPPCLPQDWDSLYNATLESIRNPIGMPTLRELAHKGSSVVIVIPDIVKGGNQPTSHRKVAIRACLDELYAAGVEKKDILLLFSNGLHPRATVAEMQTILGPELFNEFYPSGQITSHDSEDYDHLVDLGHTAQGDHVIMNKYVYDADVAILIGHTQGNPYGGYSGGYKHCATGISHWRSIAAHHVPQVMHRPDFVPVSTNSEMRHKFDQQGMLMEEKMGKKFFCCDAVLDTKSRQIEIHSGWAKEMQPISWKMADKRTYVHWAEKKYDIIVFGMPTNFHYGNGMGTNPIQMMQALSAQVIRHKRRPLRVHRVLHLRRVLPRRALALPAGAVRPVPARLHEHPPRHEPLRRVLRHQGGVHPQVPLRQRLPPLPRLLHDELRPPGRGAHQRHLHRGRPGAGYRPGHGPEDPRHLRGGPGRRHAQVHRPQPQHPGPAPHLHHRGGSPVHEGSRPQLRPRGRLPLRRLSPR